MGALSKIRAAGFGVSLVDGFIEIDPASKLTSSQREFLKLHKAEIVEELQADDLGALPQVKPAETDTAANDPTKMIVASCGQCIQFKSFNDHGRGAGTCNSGVQSPGVNFWSDTKHQCDKFTSRDWWIVKTGESYSITTIPPSTYAEMLEIEPEAIIIQPTTVCRLENE
ncbi:MAG: hypothetical protein Q8Q40_13865 [Methylococcaceae bacterium]|nr:hypothetical protein [Methylococcaceae bacterium]MDP3905043.1 hypothetical protein [Methylococcaceae bacterium]